VKGSLWAIEAITIFFVLVVDVEGVLLNMQIENSRKLIDIKTHLPLAGILVRKQSFTFLQTSFYRVLPEGLKPLVMLCDKQYL